MVLLLLPLRTLPRGKEHLAPSFCLSAWSLPLASLMNPLALLSNVLSPIEVDRLRKLGDPPPLPQPVEPSNDQLATEQMQHQEQLKKQVGVLQVCLFFDLAVAWSAGLGTVDFPCDLPMSQTGELNSKDDGTQELTLEFVSYLFDAMVAAMPWLWVVPFLVTWFCPGPDVPIVSLPCVLAATVLFFLQSWLSAVMLVCDLVGAALAQRRCPSFRNCSVLRRWFVWLEGTACSRRFSISS